MGIFGVHTKQALHPSLAPSPQTTHLHPKFVHLLQPPPFRNLLKIVKHLLLFNHVMDNDIICKPIIDLMCMRRRDHHHVHARLSNVVITPLATCVDCVSFHLGGCGHSFASIVKTIYEKLLKTNLSMSCLVFFLC